MILKPARRTNIPATIATNVRAQILRGELPAGTQLPGHRELAAMYSVSVGSVREAISMLVSSGLIQTRAGRGTYVASTGALFLRAGELCVWDRAEGGATRWARLRPDCWISTVPACGMLLSPEGGGGCSCGSWMEASMGFRPRGAR